MKRYSSFPEKSSKRSSVDIKCMFDNPAEFFSPKVRKFFAQSLEFKENIYSFLKKDVFPQNDPVDS